MKNPWKTALFMLGLVTVFFWQSEASTKNVISEANRAYMEQRYTDAIEGYRQALEQGHQNGHIYYNLGNAYFEEGKLGKAVLNYLKARELLPRNEDIKANLKHAWRSSKDKLEWHAPHPASAVLFWLEDVTLNENLKALTLTCLIFWTIQAARSIKKTAVWDVAGRIALLCLITAALSTGARWHLDQHTQYGVVLSGVQNVLSQPNSPGTTAYTLHKGTIIRVTATRGDWTQVQLIDGRKGWVPKAAIGI